MSPRYTNLLALPTALLALVVSYSFSVNALSHLSPVSSPEASTNLICHTSNPADCYPTIFSPTKDFQIVHDDQSIPTGLHVRMNLATGLKEARLNVPEEDQDDESAIVVIDNASSQEETLDNLDGHPPSIAVQDPSQEYDAFWQGKLSEAPAPGHDIDTFKSLTSALIEDSSATASRLNALTEAVHDIEWGLALAEDYVLTARILELISFDSTAGNLDAKSAAALTLGTALQNNDKARDTFISNCQQHDFEPTKLLLSELEATHEAHVSGRASPQHLAFAGRLVFLVSQLCRDNSQLQIFSKGEGLRTLGAFFGEEKAGPINNDGLARVQARIANFVADHAPALVSSKLDDQLLRFCQIFSAARSTMSTEHLSHDSVCEAKTVLDDLLGERCN